MEFTLAKMNKAKVNLRQHYSGRWDQLLDPSICYLQSEASVELFDLCRDFARKQGLKAFSNTSGEGLLSRHVIVREGKHTGNVMLNIVTSAEYFPQMDRFVQAI